MSVHLLVVNLTIFFRFVPEQTIQVTVQPVNTLLHSISIEDHELN
jgi:hypothetical protein